jgi:GNAT superfamily N-acetyltransferase
MKSYTELKRTTTDDPAFIWLVVQLDHELWHELYEDQGTYDQHNKVPGISTALVLYADGPAVACGCFKPFDESTVEVKRMFVVKEQRGKGYAKVILQALEQCATELGYTAAVLETSIHFGTARRLYQSSGYAVIPNYGPYEKLPESICLKKNLS